MTFTLLCWNILAPIHVRPERYPRVAPENLDGDGRLERILVRLRALDPDVIALQEVEPGWAARLSDGLRDRDYDWRLTLKQLYKLEGIALFVRRGTFGPVTFDEVLYREQVAGVEPTGNVGLLASGTFAGRAIRLGTTHIKWEPPDVPAAQHRGVIQTTQLLAHLRRADDMPTVLCGDFNATYESPILAPLWDAGFRDPFANDDQPTGAFSNVATRIDFLVHTRELSGVGDRLPILTGSSVLPSAEEPSDHLPLRATLSWA